MTHFVIERLTQTHLAVYRKRWTFWYDDRVHSLRCSRHIFESKPKGKRKFYVTGEWNQHRGELNPPNLPGDVIVEALQAFSAGLGYRPWEPR